MTGYLVGLAAAVGSGILTSLHPCPLTTNIAAVTFLAGWTANLRQTVWAGLVYTLGRIFTYVCLGILLVSLALSIPTLAVSLQYYASRLLGPFLILTGMLISGLITLPKPRATAASEGRLGRMAQRKMLGSFLLGVMLALTFCPASAGLFFGVLIPLAVSEASGLLYPAAFGVGTGLPVLVIVLLISTGVTTLERGLKNRDTLERWVPRVAGVALILVGVYYTLDKVYQVIGQHPE
jgi:cytochrome c biogenesis protein CcdA